MKLNLGCGDDKLPGFINIDIDIGVKPDLVCDIKKLPYGDESISEIVCSDILEHFGRAEVFDVMGEIRRVIKSGGRLDVRVPEMRMLSIYLAGQQSIASPDAVIRKMFGGQRTDFDFHKWGYEFRTLRRLLFNFGFKKIIGAAVIGQTNYGISVCKDGGILQKDKYRIILSSASKTNYPHDTGLFLSKALRKMGHEVLEYDFRIEVDSTDQSNPNIQEMVEFKPDLVVAWKCFMGDVHKVMSFPCPILLWYPDDIQHTEHGKNAIGFPIPYSDIVATFNIAGCNFLRKLGFDNVFHIPCGVDLETYRKLDGVEKKYDVLFVGAMNGQREKAIRLIKSWGIDVEVRSDVYGDDLVRLYNEARIIFNLGIGPSGYQLRVFEGMACGSCVVTNRIEPEEGIFQHRQDLIFYQRDYSDLKELLESYLRDDGEREKVAIRGHEVVKDCTWENSLDSLFKYFLLYQSRRTRIHEEIQSDIDYHRSSERESI